MDQSCHGYHPVLLKVWNLSASYEIIQKGKIFYIKFVCDCVTSVLVWLWFWLCDCASFSCPLMSSESMLDAEAELILDLDEWPMERTSWSLTVPTDPVRRWCALEGGWERVADEYEEEDDEEDSEVCLAASSMLRDAFSSWAVISSREKLEARGRDWLLPSRTVEAGEALVLLLVLPPLLPPPVCLVLVERPVGLCLNLPSEVLLMGLPIVLSSCSIEHRSAMRASKSTVSPWLMAST